jgi:hypothetical protein
MTPATLFCPRALAELDPLPNADEFTALADLSSTGTSLSLTPEEHAAKAEMTTATDKARINI